MKVDPKAVIPKSLENYQIGEQIAKGGFGTVHRGLNSDTGAAVAIKRISLENIPPDELNSIQMEIDLLKELEHEHIVQYVGSHRTKDHLYIILDYVENGSLAAAVKKFGTFKEPLVASYTYQTLIGLAYLHEQGVIHRDIKGANILTTKDGTVKLADFGVATKDGGAMDDDSVVGTPYWMAPEIIEMSGASTKSDVWSVGCTIIELLTGSPPYFDLAPMPALFRIVQDPMPPLPEGISPALKDFLNLCFRKEPERRASAAELLEHRWLKDVKTRYGHEKGKKAFPDRHSGRDGTGWSEVAKSTLEKFQGGIFFRNATSKTIKAPQAEADIVDEEDWDDIDLDDNKAPIPQPSTSHNTLSLNAVKTELAGATIDDDDFDFEEEGNDKVVKEGSQMRTTLAAGAAQLADLTVEDKLEKLAEESDDEDFGLDIEPVVLSREKSKSVGMRKGSNEDIDWQAFEEVDAGEDDERMKKEAEEGEFERLINQLQPTAKPNIILDACGKIEAKLLENPALKDGFIVHHGVIPILEMLEISGVQVRSAILRVLLLLIDGNNEMDRKLRLNLCLTGLIPFLLQFGSPDSQISVRSIAAQILEKITLVDDIALQLLIGCRGLPVFIGFLEPDFAVMKELALTGVRCLWRTFQMRSPTPKSDLCRLLLRADMPGGTPYRLLATIQNMIVDPSSKSEELVDRAIEIFGYFCHSDETVKSAVAVKESLAVLLSIMQSTKREDRLLKLFKSFKDLAGGRATTLDLLEAGGAIEAIIEFAKSPMFSGQEANPQLMNMILFSLSRLCSIKLERHERAAKAGAIPILLSEIEEEGQMKNVAFDVICSMARGGSKIARKEFERHNATEVFLASISNGWMGLDALGALTSLIAQGDTYVIDIVKKEENLARIGTAIAQAEAWMMEKITEYILKIVENSPVLNQMIGTTTYIVPSLLATVQSQEGVVLCTNMRIVRSLYRQHKKPKKFIGSNNLIHVLKTVSESQTALARKLAEELLVSFSADYLM